MYILNKIILRLKWLNTIPLIFPILMGQNTEYIILTNEAMEDAAIILAELHSNSVERIPKLETKVILIESEASASDIRNIVQNEITYNSDLMYLRKFIYRNSTASSCNNII